MTTKLVGEINDLDDFWIDGKKYAIHFVENLEFDLANNACLIEYEEDNESHDTDIGCEFDDALVIDKIVNQLHADWSVGANETLLPAL